MKTRVTSATDMMPATGSVAPGSTIHYLLLLSNTSKDEIIKRTVTDTPGPGLAITAADPDENSGTATITDGEPSYGRQASSLQEARRRCW